MLQHSYSTIIYLFFVFAGLLFYKHCHEDFRSSQLIFPADIYIFAMLEDGARTAFRITKKIKINLCEIT